MQDGPPYSEGQQVLAPSGLRDCETAKACRTSDQPPTGRIVALPSHQNGPVQVSNVDAMTAQRLQSDAIFSDYRKRQLLGTGEETEAGGRGECFL